MVVVPADRATSRESVKLHFCVGMKYTQEVCQEKYLTGLTHFPIRCESSAGVTNQLIVLPQNSVFFCSSSFVLAKTTVKRFATTIQYCFLLIYSAICKFITAPYEITWKFNRSAVFSNVGRCDVTHCLCYGCACYLKRVCPNGNADDITVRLRVSKKNFSCVCVCIHLYCLFW